MGGKVDNLMEAVAEAQGQVLDDDAPDNYYSVRFCFCVFEVFFVGRF